MRRALAIPAAAALVLGGASAATAAPPSQEVLDLACGDGQRLTVVVNGNGNWTPGRVVDSTQVLVPISFGDFMFRAETPEGKLLHEERMPGVMDSKGKGNVAKHNPRPTTTCTFSETMVLDQPEENFPAGTVLTFSGSVTAHLTGRS